MEHPPHRLRPVGRQSRRGIVAAIAGGGGALLLATAGSAFWQSGSGGASGGDHEEDGGSGRGRGHDPGGDDENGAAAQLTGPIPPGAALVEIFDDDGFTPASLTVDPGQPIAFVNRDGDDHTATGSAFDTGIIPEQGGVASVVLDAPGTYPFACRIHPEMVGTIGVRGPDGVVPPPAPATPAPAGAAMVRIAGFAFDPPTLTVPLGTTVAWSNEDSVPHTATALDGGFDSGIFDPGGVFSQAFGAPGTYPYRCNVHPSMLGEIVVAGTPVPSDTPSGAATPAPVAAPNPGSVGIAGAWAVTLTPDGPGLAPQAGLLALRGDGTLDAALAPTGPDAGGGGRRTGAGFGSWRTIAERDHVLSVTALLLDDSGQFAGRIAIGGAVTLDATGNAFAGTFVFETRSSTGDQDGAGGGEIAGERV